MAFPMPGFEQLPNAQLAQILTFIRSSWGNQASAVSEVDVARMRRVVRDKPCDRRPGAGRCRHPCLSPSLPGPGCRRGQHDRHARCTGQGGGALPAAQRRRDRRARQRRVGDARTPPSQ
ncbi:hypothetical protein G6F24_017671 [Rhizopus arrhizus]|nr:hypothetical protein G6F24_017671 [Rhizopus arrhizus]